MLEALQVLKYAGLTCSTKNEGLRSFHNHGEGPYYGLLLVVVIVAVGAFSMIVIFSPKVRNQL